MSRSYTSPPPSQAPPWRVVGQPFKHFPIFILRGLLFVGAPWVWSSSHYDISWKRGVWVSCVAVVDT
jgi:hypothetical protein